MTDRVKILLTIMLFLMLMSLLIDMFGWRFL